jgi:hypothetical protein
MQIDVSLDNDEPDLLRVRISGSVPLSSDVQEVKDFISAMKNFGKDVFSIAPESHCQIVASYIGEDGEPVEISVWEKRPQL